MKNKNIKLLSLLAMGAMLFACGGEGTPSNEPSNDPVISENGSVEAPSEEQPSVEAPSEEQPSEEQPSEEPTYVTEVEAEKAYKLMIDQKGAGKKLYYAGGYVNTYYGATTEDASLAVDLVLKETDGGYYVGYLDGTTSTFINTQTSVSGDKTHNNIKFETTPKSVWTFDTEYHTLTTTCGENTVYMGTYSTYTTLSLSTVSHLTEDTSYPARLYVSDAATPEVVLPENGGSGDTEQNPTSTTIAQLNEVGNGLAEAATSSSSYTFTAVVTAIGGKEVTVTDDTGSIIIYNNNNVENLYMDYEVTITGYVKNYYGKIEIVDFTLDSYVAATYEVTFAAMENGTVVASKSEGIEYNENVTLTVNPAEGYKLNELYVNGTLAEVTDNSYTVTATSDIEVTATFVSEDTVVVQKEVRTYDFSKYAAGTQYAVNEVTALDDVITMTTTECHLNTQLRIYSSSTHDGVAYFASTNDIYGISVNAGNKVDVLNVYVSEDGSSYELYDGISVTSTAYSDYTLDFGGAAYKYVKIDVAGSQQIRLQSISFTIAK